MNIDLQIPQIQNLYQSFDNGKLRSTIINLDIEEMSYCLAKGIFKMVQEGQAIQQSQNQRYKHQPGAIRISASNMKEEKPDIQGYIDRQYEDIAKSNMKNSLCKISEMTAENTELSHLLEKKIVKHQFRKQQQSQMKASKQNLEDILRDSFLRYQGEEQQ